MIRFYQCAYFKFNFMIFFIIKNCRYNFNTSTSVPLVRFCFLKLKIFPDVVEINGTAQQVGKKIDIGKEAAIEAEVRAAKERAVIPLETRMKLFKEMLSEKQVSAFSTWEKELHKIVFDSRYLLLTSKERKQVFEKYVKERAEEERREKRNKLREKKEAYRRLLQESHLHGKYVFAI